MRLNYRKESFAYKSNVNINLKVLDFVQFGGVMGCQTPG